MRPAERSTLRRRRAAGRPMGRVPTRAASRGARDRWLLVGLGLLFGLLLLTWFDVGSGPSAAAPSLHAAR